MRLSGVIEREMNANRTEKEPNGTRAAWAYGARGMVGKETRQGSELSRREKRSPEMSPWLEAYSPLKSPNSSLA